MKGGSLFPMPCFIIHPKIKLTCSFKALHLRGLMSCLLLVSRQDPNTGHFFSSYFNVFFSYNWSGRSVFEIVGIDSWDSSIWAEEWQLA